jgi:hypothetical protein
LIHQGRRIGATLIPDAVFGLHFLDRPEGRNRAYFFLEADRGTMPVERANLHRTSVVRKILQYRETWERSLHTQRFGISNFRVLTVTEGADRAEHIRAATLKATRGELTNLFLCLDHEAFLGRDPIAGPWLNARTQGRTLRE